MSDQKSLQEEIVEVCLRRGIIFPTAEIYGGVAGFYEFGPVGQTLRLQLINLWRQHFIQSEENIVEIFGSTILPEKVFEASGHIEGFSDPLTQCDKCKSMYRADHLLENHDTETINFDVLTLQMLDTRINELKIRCPSCGGNLLPTKKFNLMFETTIGPSSDKKGYLRPETAQNIFINFKRIANFLRDKLPFGVAQIGKAYRNEISPRNFLVRMREFEQMEIEMFVNPDEINEHPSWDEISDLEINILTRENQLKKQKFKRMTVQKALDDNIIPNQYFGYYLALESEFIEMLGVETSQFWFRHLLEDETAHYSKANFDLEVQFPFGVVECVGNAYRTDYDLKKHQEYSKANLFVVTPEGKKIVPHVIEPSFGVTRLIYIILLNAYQNKSRDWTWFKFPNVLAPYEVLVAPLMKKDGLKEEAYNFFWELKDEGIDVIYDESGKIGKRYARADEVGVLYCITIDYQSLEDETVTIRDRDTTIQYRIPTDATAQVVKELVLGLISFEDLQQEFEEINAGDTKGVEKRKVETNKTQQNTKKGRSKKKQNKKSS